MKKLKKLSLIVIALTIMVSSFSFVKAQNVQYYKRLTDYRSLYDLINEEIAKTIPHYKATYEGENVVIIEYLTTEHSVQNDKNGISTVKFKYNEKGKVIEDALYNKDGSLVNNPTVRSKSAINRFKYDDKGYRIEESYYDKDDKLTTNGMAIYRKKYEEGRKIEQATYDNNNNLKENFEGYAIVRDKFDKKGRLLEESYYNKNDQPTERVGEYSKVVRLYDDNAKTNTVTYYKKDGSILKTEQNKQ
jgi:hypothetical protein